MLKRVITALLTVVGIAGLAQVASAQYMYMDTNGNGVHDPGDRLNANNDSTVVDIYLNTSTNRDGSPVTCNTAPGTAMQINSYAVNLAASGGTVQYRNYINRASTQFPNPAQSLNPGDGTYKNAFFSFSYSPPGLYRLATLTITGTGQSPRVNVVDQVANSEDFTSFGTLCPGQAGDNTYRMDGPLTRAFYELLGLPPGTPGDWFDNDGVDPAPTGNNPPVVTNPGNRTVNEQTNLAFTVVATDPDAGQTLTYTLTLGTPAATGATINATTGAFSWTPSEAQGPGVYPVTVTATDNATPTPASGSAGFSITVNEVNTAPVVTNPGNKVVNELANLAFTVTATDSDIPANTITWSLTLGTPPATGATIGAGTGAFSWTPTEAQGPGTYPVTIVATDNGAPAMNGSAGISITVNEVNQAPVVTNPGNKTTAELANLAFTVTATDADVPANTITWSLTLGTPAATGATIGAGTGAFSWTPTEAQGPGTYPVTIVATDNGTPAMTGSAAITISVTEVNSAPVLTAIGNKTGTVGTPVTFTATATDADIPANTLAFSLDAGAPAGATINGSTGAFSWTPTASGTFPVTVRVTDNGSPALNDFEAINIVVGSNNQPPVVTNPGNRTVNELTPLTFTATATDPNAGDVQTWSLTLGSPAATGATINASTGAFSWTPTEAQGPGVYPVTITSTDNGSPPLSGSAGFSITVNEVNSAPVVTNPGNKTTAETANLAFTVTATDSDIPANTITWSLTLGTPAATGATIGAGTGAFSWTPTETQGPGTYPVTIVATDNGAPALSGNAAITITVTEVNVAPVVANPGNKTTAELANLAFTVTATDADFPANTITFSLTLGTPAATGATIGAGTGAFSWTPTEAQGPGTYPVTIVATDDGTPAMSGSAGITILVTEVNSAPVLAAIGNKTGSVGTPVTFTATATDSDIPANTLTFSLDAGAPAGATINGSTGAFSWTPTASGTFPVTVRVTDNGSPALSDFEAISIVVGSNNQPPVVTNPGNRTVNELATLAFTATATDPNAGDVQTWSLTLGTPAATGATINASTGAFSWTPTEAQGPGVYPVTITSTDNGSPPLSGSAGFSITVNEVNSAPVVTSPGNRTLNENTNVAFTVTATDSDIPANTITWSLTLGSPAATGATIGAGTGAFSWTPTEAQGPGTYPVTIVATDNGTPALSGNAAITITVNEVNIAPVLAAIGNKTGTVGTPVTFTATAVDGDIPANTLTFSLDAGAPAGATINGSTGAFSWTPTASGTFPVTVRVTDNGSPALSDFEVISIVIGGGNQPPVVTNPGNRTVNELTPLTFTATATDPNAGDVQTWSLALGTPPATGATINASTGAFSWTPTEAQGPGTYPVTITATDNGNPPLSGSTGFSITVNEVNSAPVVTNPGNKTTAETANLAFTVTATDSDIPANNVTWSLTLGTPAATGATIGASSGAFSWTPTEAQGPGTYPVTIVATDNGTPAMTGSAAITISVTEVNVAPVLAPIGNKTGSVGTPVTFTATATDADVPANTLTFSLDAGAPSGATINASTGAFSWTPTASGTFPVTVRVTDNGSPALNDFEAINIVIGGGNQQPVLAAIGNKTTNELATLTFTASATDPNAGDVLTFSLDAGAPSGATISGSTGAFSWTPTEAQGPNSYPITVRVTDNGSPQMSDFETIQVDVTEVNVAPVLAAIGNKSVTIGNTLTFTATATDADIPANTLTFSLDAGAPSGATINGSTGAFSWTPGATGTFPVTVRVTDNGSPAMSDFEAITITVNDQANQPPVVTNPGNKTVNELATLAFTVTASDANGDPLTFSLDAGAPAGATIGASTGAFSWTPTEAQGPNVYPVTVRATDNRTPPESGTAQLTITVNEVNVAPVLAAIGDRTVDEMSLLAFTATATDADIPANTLTFSLDVGAPSGATINGSTGAFSWTPSEAQGPNVYPVTVRVTDNGIPAMSDFETIQVTVNEVNGTPTANAGGPYSGSVNTDIQFNGTGSTDPDGDPLTYDWTFGDGGTGTGATPKHSYAAEATYTVTLRVTDPAGLYDDDATTATIRAEIAVNIVLKKGKSTLLIDNDGLLKIAIEEGDLPLSSIVLGSLRISTDYPNAGTVSECAADPRFSKTDDLDHNGVTDLEVRFPGTCVTSLFSNVPNNTSVNLILTGLAQTETGTIPLRGVKVVTIQRGTGAPVLAAAFPNPFNPETSISYSVRNDGLVTMRIYSINGRLIRTLKQNEATTAGSHEVTWNGTDDHGQHVPSGIYLVKTSHRADGSEESVVFKLAVAK